MKRPRDTKRTVKLGEYERTECGEKHHQKENVFFTNFHFGHLKLMVFKCAGFIISANSADKKSLMDAKL